MKNCKHCGNLFEPRTDRENPFCSISCANKSRRKNYPKPCLFCKEYFQPPQNHPLQKYCTTSCRDKARNRRKIVSCSTCDKEIVRPRKRLKQKNFYCSRKCEDLSRWRGGCPDYRGPNWHKQRLLALKRDNHLCQHCGNQKNLQVHHKRPAAEFDDYEKANHPDNLITLCRPCHQKEEQEYRKNNPFKQAPSLSKTA